MAYRIDMTPSGRYKKKTIAVSQDDVGREIVVCLFKDGSAYSIPSGATVTMQGTKPSGLGFTVSGTYAAGSSEVTFDSTAEMTEEYGIFASQIVMAKGTKVVGSENFSLLVEKNPHPSTVIDGSGA